MSVLSPVTTCDREVDVLDAIHAARWPDRVDAELAAHVAACDVCRDVAAMAPIVAAGQAGPFAHVRLPESGAVWIRAQMRARAEAARAATRPITVVQALALASAAAVAGAFVGATSAWLQSWLGRVSAAVSSGLAALAAVPVPAAEIIRGHATWALVATAALVAVSLAAYLTTRTE